MQKAPPMGAGLRNMPKKFRSLIWGDVQGCFSTQLSMLVEWLNRVTWEYQTPHPLDVRILLQEYTSQFVARLLRESPLFCSFKRAKQCP
ncbi:conserved hypothetical protein [Vibrio crassostreae]|nr:conserved hypothetical protein [Vibrio crassostreae]CAK1769951.1 conserved hypothetical protein [Vibrio crassostreae]CAK1781952.1 conserved hypothetical protein [Vibrio crassostreae]CAK1786945.1 conserved hypothetical protein [Vibrio crassostreae]CAK1789445.1 conserved hypothetical protein [Vibrio crassostreae]